MATEFRVFPPLQDPSATAVVYFSHSSACYVAAPVRSETFATGPKVSIRQQVKRCTDARRVDAPRYPFFASATLAAEAVILNVSSVIPAGAPLHNDVIESMAQPFQLGFPALTNVKRVGNDATDRYNQCMHAAHRRQRTV